MNDMHMVYNKIDAPPWSSITTSKRHKLRQIPIRLLVLKVNHCHQVFVNLVPALPYVGGYVVGLFGVLRFSTPSTANELGDETAHVFGIGI